MSILKKILTIGTLAYSVFAGSKSNVEEAILTRAPYVPPYITRRENKVVHAKLVCKEVESTIAKGIRYRYSTFEGRVPGPCIRLLEGDDLLLELVNPVGNRHRYSIYMHAITGPGGGSAITVVSPGKTVTMKCRMLNPGVYMYYSGGMHIGVQAANGMFGMILVQPKNLAPVDKEFCIIQSEVYTNGREKRLLRIMKTAMLIDKTKKFQKKMKLAKLKKTKKLKKLKKLKKIKNSKKNNKFNKKKKDIARSNRVKRIRKELKIIMSEMGVKQIPKHRITRGKISKQYKRKFAVLAKFDIRSALNENPTYVFFNGSYARHTAKKEHLVARVGETVRMYVGNAGPNLILSFHVMGEIFDKVYIEGGAAINKNVQTTLVPPGGTVVVEFKVEVPGYYAFIDHAIFRALHKGAIGILRVEGPKNLEVFSVVKFPQNLKSKIGIKKKQISKKTKNIKKAKNVKNAKKNKKAKKNKRTRRTQKEKKSLKQELA